MQGYKVPDLWPQREMTVRGLRASWGSAGSFLPSVPQPSVSLHPALLPLPVDTHCHPKCSQTTLLHIRQTQSLSTGTWTQVHPSHLTLQGCRDLEEEAEGRLTHDHVVADITESGLLEDVLLKGVGLAAAWVQAGPGDCGRQASGGREQAGAGADLRKHVGLQFRIAVGSLEEVVSTFAP